MGKQISVAAPLTVGISFDLLVFGAGAEGGLSESVTAILANLSWAKRAGFEQSPVKRLVHGEEREGRAAVA